MWLPFPLEWGRYALQRSLGGWKTLPLVLDRVSRSFRRVAGDRLRPGVFCDAFATVKLGNAGSTHDGGVSYCGCDSRYRSRNIAELLELAMFVVAVVRNNTR